MLVASLRRALLLLPSAPFAGHILVQLSHLVLVVLLHLCKLPLVLRLALFPVDLHLRSLLLQTLLHLLLSPS
jgi:hypothetical protein